MNNGMRSFKIIPKRAKRVNGQVLTPDMIVVVTTKSSVLDPFSNNASEVKEIYMRIYGFDYCRAKCCKNDFIVEPIL